MQTLIEMNWPEKFEIAIKKTEPEMSNRDKLIKKFSNFYGRQWKTWSSRYIWHKPTKRKKQAFTYHLQENLNN